MLTCVPHLPFLLFFYCVAHVIYFLQICEWSVEMGGPAIQNCGVDHWCCHYCGVKFFFPQDLRDHCVTQHPEMSQKFLACHSRITACCTVCSKYFHHSSLTCLLVKQIISYFVSLLWFCLSDIRWTHCCRDLADVWMHITRCCKTKKGKEMANQMSLAWGPWHQPPMTRDASSSCWLGFFFFSEAFECNFMFN